MHNAALEVFTIDAAPRDWAVTKNNLGKALRALGELEGDKARLESAVAVHNAALEVFTIDAAPRDWAVTQDYRREALRTLER